MGPEIKKKEWIVSVEMIHSFSIKRFIIFDYCILRFYPVPAAFHRLLMESDNSRCIRWR